MKAKMITGMMLMALSSLSVAPVSAGTASDLSRSPFQVDRDKATAQKGTVTPAPVRADTVTSQGVVPTAGGAATEHPATAGAYNPWLTLNLQKDHLLSQDVEAWATSRGMRLLWNSNRDYLIYSTISLTGKNRDDVLNQLGQLFRSENYGLVVKLYEKNNVLVIDGQ